MRAPILSRLALAAALSMTLGQGLGGCSSTTSPDLITRAPACEGKCDGTQAYVSPYKAVVAKMNEIWPATPKLRKVADAYTVTLKLGDQTIKAPTHLFGVPVAVVPYANEDDALDAEGKPFGRGDAEIARAFPRGSIGYAIKHHRPEFRKIDLAQSGGELKEHLKLQDTHIEIVVGVQRDGVPGAITINNPQAYERGRFGTPKYSMVFVKPQFPSYVPQREHEAFVANIRTMLVGFNTVSVFPGDYNGGDPLAARTPDEVRRHTAMMVRAVTGDAEARAFFDDPANNIYCAELAHVATSAGLIVPLNAKTMVPLVGQATWDAFVAEIEKARAKQPSKLVDGNPNTLVGLVDVTVAPETLAPMSDYAPADARAAEAQKLAFKPFTMADIVEHFLRTHVPREQLGEGVAPAQGALLQQMQPGLLEAMGMNALPTTDPRRQAVDQLFGALVQVVSTPHADYAAFRAALEPLLGKARIMTGPRDNTGVGLFVPPSLLHVVAQGKNPGGLLTLKYVGHGIHVSAVKKSTTTSTPEPAVDPDEPFGPSCGLVCGGFSPDLTCACDALCAQNNDCCADYQPLCVTP